MADNSAQPTLADILLAEELGQPRPRRPWMPEVGAGGYGLPYLPPLPPRAPRELRSGLDPAVDQIMGMTGLPTSAGSTLDLLYALGSAGPRQVQRAETAIGEAVSDPSLANVTNAGVHTGLAAMRPAIALGSLGAGYTGAALSDLGVFDAAQAEAQGRKGGAPKMVLPGLSPEQQQMHDEAVRKLERGDFDNAAARRMLEDTVREMRALSIRQSEGKAGQEREAEALAAKSRQAEYDRQVATAEAARDRELARDRRFSDTATGQLYDKTGGLAPFLAGALSGGLSRAVHGNETWVRALVPPAIYGTLAGIGSANVPLAYNALGTEPDNPQKRAYEAYGRELPPSHPRRQEWMDYASKLPEGNPVRSAASQEFYDPQKMKERALMGGLEGFLGAEIGANFGTLAQRASGLAGRLLRGPGGRPQTTAMPGVVVDGIPSGGVSVGAPTAAQRTVAPIPPGSSSSPTGRPPGDQKLVGGAPPSLPASGEPSLADVLMRLDPANFNRAHHSRYQPRGQKGNPGAFKKGKPEYPDNEK